MRNTRVTTLMVAAAVVVGLVAPWAGSAHAATTRTVVSRAGLPSGVALDGLGCGGDDSTRANDQAIHVTGPAKPPLGKGSLAVTGRDDIALVPTIKPQSATDLTSFSLGYDAPPLASASAVMLITVDLNYSSAGYDTLQLAIAPTSRWETANFLTASLEASDTSGTTTTDDGATTYAQFLTAHPGSTIHDAYIEVLNCAGGVATGVAFDALSLGINGATTVYDFEPDSALRATITSPHASRKGVPVAITGFLDRGRAAIPDLAITLQARAKGAKAWTDAATVTTRYNGALYDVELPTRTTSFRWTYPGSSDAGAITSKVTTIKIVKPKKPKKHRK